ncbi:DUF3553 domain-containing protein [Actinacidiphila alni]|uniref:DUF3553 domain-containing protein n=1 Tax=Actinacidiphila alni TaxID=380248 RepID=UPI002AFF4F30|nr:DUF3553 domain-containing protein [Actinacidiphila alni]
MPAVTTAEVPTSCPAPEVGGRPRGRLLRGRGAPLPAPGICVLHAHWGDGSVMSADDGQVTVLFDTAGYRTLSIDAVPRNGLLTVG